MTVQTIPDLLGALVVRYRAVTAIAALTGTRISANRQDADWAPMPRHAIFLEGPLGNPGETIYDNLKGIQKTRVDVHFYGSNPYEATRLWRTAHPYICPRAEFVGSFNGSGVHVYSVRKEGGPTRFAEPDTEWPRTIATYVFTWSEIPVT